MARRRNNQSAIALAIREEAAALERSGAAQHAAAKWLEAAEETPEFTEREWCLHRATFCQTRFMKRLR